MSLPDVVPDIGLAGFHNKVIAYDSLTNTLTVAYFLGPPPNTVDAVNSYAATHVVEMNLRENPRSDRVVVTGMSDVADTQADLKYAPDTSGATMYDGDAHVGEKAIKRGFRVTDWARTEFDVPGTKGGPAPGSAKGIRETKRASGKLDVTDENMNKATFGHEVDALAKVLYVDTETSAAVSSLQDGAHATTSLTRAFFNKDVRRKRTHGVLSALNIEDPSMYIVCMPRELSSMILATLCRRLKAPCPCLNSSRSLCLVYELAASSCSLYRNFFDSK